MCETGIRMPAFRLVKDGSPLPAASYTEDIPWRPGSFSGIARPELVAREHADGATIVLQALHLHWRPAALYCRGLERRLGFPVQANAYATPGGAQGFAVHHDTHDVFVLQVAGTKRWRVYAPVLELPLKDQRWSPELGDPGDPVMDFTLEAGDTLYLPRGWPHEAFAAEADSLHLTVGLHPPTRLEALRAALDAAAVADVELRRTLNGDIPRLPDPLAPEEVARRARRRFVATRRPILDDQLTQARAAGRLGPGDPVERRATVIADLEPGDAGVTLCFEGRELRFPPQARDAVAAVHEREGPFTAADLPESLDVAGRLVLVRRLVREGYLRALSP